MSKALPTLNSTLLFTEVEISAILFTKIGADVECKLSYAYKSVT